MITGLNHFNLRAPTELMRVLRDFYRDVLGLQEGARPAFQSRGYWLYAGGQPVLHLSEQRPGEPLRAPVRADAPTTFDHIAFSGSQPAAMAARLRAAGVAFHEERSPVTRQHQFFLQDPAGNGVEINFPFSSSEG